MTRFCATCKCKLDDPKRPFYSEDCGGDCLLCMAEAGDPECEKAVLEYRDKIKDSWRRDK